MNSPSGGRLAIIDNDSGFVRVLANRLETAGWEFRVIPGPVPASDLVAMKLDALVLDPQTPGLDFWSFLDQVGGLMPSLGIMVCSLGSTVSERVRGLRLGADDWIVKPAHPEEVIARIEAVVRRRRRSEPKADRGPMVAGELEIRSDQFQVFVSGRSAELTRREFELLDALAASSGEVFQREDIYRRVWGYEMAHGDRSVDVFIRKVRSKVERVSPGWTYIHTHFGVGYRFEPEARDAPAAQEPGEGSQPVHTSGSDPLKTAR